jgi:sarcosine oxidase subunit beta
MRLVSPAELRRSWAGHCGGTPDRRLLVGPVSERLFIAGGGNGVRVVHGPALGECAAPMALGLDSAPRADPFRFPPGAFALRPASGGLSPE